MMMVTYAAVIYFFFIPTDFGYIDSSIPLKILGLLFISTVVLPIAALLLMVRIGKVENVQMDQQKERNWPLLQSAIIYFGAYYVVHSRVVPIFIQLFLLGAIIGIVISLLINLRWKISLHMIGIGGLCGGISAIMFLLNAGNPMLLSICFIIAGLLGTVRLFLQAHTLTQILAGFTTGFLVEFLLLFTMLS